MNLSTLTNQQRAVAVQRLTALWAFAESGLGGVMHALKIPFTGLVVGGLAVILITFIAHFSKGSYRQIFQSLLIVLIVKAAVSPHTPFPAYIAVSFQAIAGFILFSLMRINFISILLFAVVAMLQSAVQKLLILTFFFGASFWKAADELSNYIAKQFSLSTLEGSYWLVGLYLFIYLAGGVLIAITAYKIIGKLSENTNFSPTLSLHEEFQIIKKKKSNKKIYSLTSFLILISLVLFVFSNSTQQASLAILSAVVWTVSALLIWYVILNPLITKLILAVLQKKQSNYAQQINETLAFLPAIKQITAAAWMKSRSIKSNRIGYFIFLLIQWTLTYSDAVQPAQK